MSSRIPLPRHLQVAPFRRHDAEKAGLSLGRLRDADILRPYCGVQTTSMPEDVVGRCRAYAVRMRPGQVFSHVTAAQLLGLPLPLHLEGDTILDVAAVRPASEPRTRGVRGRRLSIGPPTVLVDGLPVCSAGETWCQLASVLLLDDLIVVADAILASYLDHEAEVRARLAERIEAQHRVGAARLRAALAEARGGSLSPGETRTRLVLVRAGLPEPELNPRLYDEQGLFLGRGDLVWRAQRLLLEYEGDHHRTDKEQFRYDIERYECFRDAGWQVIRVTGDDLRADRERALVVRVASRLGVALPPI